MKSILLAAALLVAAFVPACTAPAPSDNSKQTASANASTPTPSPAVADPAERDRQAYEAVKRKDWDAYAAMLADEQLYVTGDGVYDKAAIVEGIKKLDIKEYTLGDFKTINVSPDVVVVTFTARGNVTLDGKPLPEVTSRESTAWVKRGDKWLSAYHQDTTVETTTPAPTPGASATPTATATTAAATPTPSSSPATAADATGMERLLWEALKRKDWDAFAGHLTDDHIKVWSLGVFDKAAAVAGVKNAEFTGATLGDFREVKLSPDVTLVTYTVKGPREAFGPDGERQSSIWVRRGGRWLAVFHQGTPITK